MLGQGVICLARSCSSDVGSSQCHMKATWLQGRTRVAESMG